MNSPTSWSWTFSGGTPASSTLQNPTGITYSAAGTYDVTLYVSNGFGNDTEVKTAYITVVDPGSPPVADFTANVTTITAGGSVDFTDLSLNIPTGWSWTFTGGIPASSALPNPTGIVYDTPGTYDVSLTVTNVNGSDNETKTAYITVNPVTSAPVVDFVADTTTVTEGEYVNFSDLSTNQPTSWLWAFENGVPSSSTLQNPTNIQYNTQGSYYVTLIATNAFGSGYLSKTQYITVLPASGTGDITSSNSLNIYPNPASDVLNIVAENVSGGYLKLNNILGQTLRIAVLPTVKGKTKISWDVASLPNGIYCLELETPAGKYTRKVIIF